MGYGDNRYGGNNERWRTPDRHDQWAVGDRGGRWERERGSYEGGGRDRERGGDRGGRSRDEDRGLFERATDEVRSWFDDDDDRGRGQGQRMSRDRGGDRSRGPESFGGGFGNQRGWSDDHFDRPGNRSGFESGREPSGGNPDRSGDEDYAQGASRSNWGGGGGGADTWGGSGFGGPDDIGRRFDRIDPGHVGGQGAHPMSSPVDAGYGGGAGSYSRSAAIMAHSRDGQHGIDPEARDRMLGRSGGRSDDRNYGQGAPGAHSFGRGQTGGGWSGQHDPHYSEWRQRQIEQLDRDYEEYRREHQSKFEQEFGGWREKRQTQRQSLGRVKEHMEVVGSDGQHVGTVDKVRGDRVLLTKSDPNAGGVHHSIPCSWIDNVDEKVTINKTADQAMRQWESEEQNRALFEEGNEGSEAPHALNRSFSGTYRDQDR